MRGFHLGVTFRQIASERVANNNSNIAGFSGKWLDILPVITFSRINKITFVFITPFSLRHNITRATKGITKSANVVEIGNLV